MIEAKGREYDSQSRGDNMIVSQGEGINTEPTTLIRLSTASSVVK